MVKHQGLRHECQLCDKSYAYPKDLRSHIEEKHRNTVWEVIEDTAMNQTDNDSAIVTSSFNAVGDDFMQRQRESQAQMYNKNGDGFDQIADIKSSDENGNDIVKQELMDVSSQVPSQMADFCEECGTEYTKPTARFCKKCGAPRELL